MDSDASFLALRTDTRPTPPPPPSSSASPTSPLSATPPTSVNEVQDSAQAGRTILYPVPPFKRAAQIAIESYTQTLQDYSRQTNVYLPQDICQIIKLRQRRERAWHVRISICASVLCNIESTLTIYKDEIEKEEAEIIRTYLQQAIARLAASENAPEPPKVPVQTKPRSKDIYNSKESKKKLLLATPSISMLPGGSQHHKGNLELPAKPPNVTESSWATVARNGHKKVRTSVPKLTPSKNMNPKPQTCLSARPQPSKSARGSKSNQNDSDKRLFAQSPLEYEWRKLSPAAIPELIVKRILVSPYCICRIKPVRSGFALSPCKSEARECLSKASNRLFLPGAKLEPAAN
ncbi:hypothetical protein K3495_g11070 [Podosphaera aphanis]|nr:hypothetical protein K3495_g11070 [Podosphaera aphanis]